MTDLIQLRRQKGACIDIMRKALRTAETERRALTPQEQRDFDDADSKVRKLDLDIIEEVEKRRAEGISDGFGFDARTAMGRPGVHRGTDDAYSYRDDDDSRRGTFSKYLRFGPAGVDAKEYRALAADGSNEGGGYLVAPTQMAQSLLKQIDEQVIVWPLAQKFFLDKAASLGVPALDGDISPEWTTELLTGTADSSMDFGTRTLTPSALSKSIYVSNKLLRIAAISPETIVRDRMAATFAAALENAFLTGDGNGQPLGVFTSSSNGVDSSRNQVCGTTTAITADGLIEIEAKLAAPYRKGACWIMSQEALTMIRKLKYSTSNEYIMASGLSAAGPNLLGYPYYVSSYAPSTFTASEPVIIFGNFQYYLIAVSLELQIQRLIEVAALTNQTVFLGRLEADGMPGLSKVFVRGVMAAN